jgi:phosphoglycolate phosphatase
VSPIAAAGVIFDLDGVLIDSIAPVTVAINEALTEHGLAPRPAAELRRFIGPPTFSAFAELTGESPDSTAVAAIVASYRRAYELRYLTQTRLIDGVLPMLEQLSARFPLAIATSKSVTFTQPLLDALELSRFFVAVAAAATDDTADDKTAIVGRALEALGQSRVAMVGDRSFDIAAAHAHALPAIGVTWGIGSSAELRAAGADRLAEHPSELVEMLQRDGEPSA